MIKQSHILLADDDKNFCALFSTTVEALSKEHRVTIIDDGEKLIQFLQKNHKKLPDILFLNLNMPRKNGSECLSAIKSHEKLKSLPVIIHSTSLHENVANLLYDKGAHYYVKKTQSLHIKKVLRLVLKQVGKKTLVRPERDQFIFRPAES